MPHSVGQVYVHLMLATRDSVPFLTDGSLRDELRGYMTGIFGNLGCPSLRIAGLEDHVHVLFRLSRVQPMVRVVEEVKTGSTFWVQTRGGIPEFGWQDGHGAFSVTPAHVDRVVHYVENQPRYHREQTFADEYRQIVLQAGGLEHRIDVHLVFSTKNRRPFLSDRVVRQLLHHRLAQICEDLGCPPLRIGGVEDHVHMLYRLSQERTLAEVSRDVKKRSSTWLGTRHRIMDFDWQDGYGAFSVSPQQVPAAMRYIENQEEHHRQETSADELQRMLNKEPQSPG